MTVMETKSAADRRDAWEASIYGPANTTRAAAEFVVAAAAYQKKSCRSGKAALDALVKLGTHDKCGRLTKHYR